MKKIYIISRYQAATEHGREFNRKVARYFCRKVIYEGNLPVAPHIYYTQFLNDDNTEDRKRGLEIGLKELKEADEFLLILIDGKISDGMRGEICQAVQDEKRGRVVYMTLKEIKEVIS
ncbi:MAG: DUF4406 domain-containing protein [Lachnospiraceae bacterium]